MAQTLVGLIYDSATGELKRMVVPGSDGEFDRATYSGPGETFSVMQNAGIPSVADAIGYVVDTTIFTEEEVTPTPMRGDGLVVPDPEG